MKYAKKITVILAIIILIIVIKNIVESINSAKSRVGVVDELQNTLEQKKKEQAYLSEKLRIAKTDEFVELEARTKLGFIREGEQVVIDIETERKEVMEPEKHVSNWEKWQNLFFR